MTVIYESDSSYSTSNSNDTAGRVVRVTGPVVDVEFPRGHVPELFNALHAEITYGSLAKTLTLEVAQHLGEHLVRCGDMIAISGVDGSVRLGAHPTADVVVRGRAQQ